jgi:hypothetical protein
MFAVAAAWLAAAVVGAAGAALLWHPAQSLATGAGDFQLRSELA